MTTPFAAAALLMMQPSASIAPPTAAAYVMLPSEDKGAADRLEQLLSADSELAAALPRRLRRAELSPGTFERCSQRVLSGGHSRCVRALVPAEEGRWPVVALFIERVAHSNVTGSRVHYTNNVWCIGHRGVGRAEVWDQLTSRSPIMLTRLRERFPGCLSDALGTAGLPGFSRDEGSGAGLWTIPVREGRLARDAAMARGQAPEQAIVESLDITPTHRNTGQCSVRARVAYVEGGERLRVDDVVQFSAPCRYGAEDPISRMMEQNGLGAGVSARIYIDRRDGELIYFEAL